MVSDKLMPVVVEKTFRIKKWKSGDYENFSFKTMQRSGNDPDVVIHFYISRIWAGSD